SGREPTGYHMTIFTFVLLILHLPYVFGLDLVLTNWLRTISLFFIFVVLWDFLWFVLNPYHPLKQFGPKHIWWHKKWWGGLPSDYYLSVLLSFLVPLPLLWMGQQIMIHWWLTQMGLFIAHTLVLIAFTLFVLKIDNWQKK
ncbi:hypothetical protein K8R42_04945, partial [bacterium]|nr:hypothetical protein [bacterium]